LKTETSFSIQIGQSSVTLAKDFNNFGDSQSLQFPSDSSYGFDIAAEILRGTERAIDTDEKESGEWDRLNSNWGITNESDEKEYGDRDRLDD